MFIQIGDSILNMNNVDFIERDYSLEGVYVINITFASGGFCRNTLETKEEAELLFNTIKIRLDSILIN